MNVAKSAHAGRAFPSTMLLFVGLWCWAIWSCAEHWRGNPNYSYGWVVPMLAFGFGLRRYARGGWKETGSAVPSRASISLQTALLFIFGGLIFGLEFARQSVWHPQIVLLLICSLAIAFTLGVFFHTGGVSFVRAELFPVLFFLTAVPWPPRFEQPITSTLMRWVAGATAEILHWLGVEAQTSGGAIALSSGLVGITEACSGIRSLQAGIMFGLAVGEWFLLRPSRRMLLLALAIALAFLTNLARTVALSLQAEWHGVSSVNDVHDLIGNITITSLIVGIWLAGKLFAPKPTHAALPEWEQMKPKVREFFATIFAAGQSEFAAILIGGILGLAGARAVYASIEARDRTQTAPFFVARADPAKGDHFVPVPKEIWTELHPTSGEYVHRENAQLPLGMADFYHFFWKPSPWNRFVLVHRPDICMPGVGWQSSGPPEAVELDFGGRKIRCHAFRFERGPYRALQLWGVWRNGEPLSLDYDAAQVLGQTAPPAALQLGGKRRSATEIVACSVVSEDGDPALEIAVELLRSVFEYKPQ